MNGPRIGFSCLWDRKNPNATWSHTPWYLREAMRRHGDVVDAGVRLARPAQLSLEVLHTRWRNGRPTTLWQQSGLTDNVVRRTVTRSAAKQHCDAVFQIQDLAAVKQPYFIYQDMSFDALLQFRELAGLGPRTDIRPDALRKRQDRQRAIYAGAAGVIAMSHWLARSLIEVTGLPAAKVAVVHPGASALQHLPDEVPVRPGPRRRLLFVGRGSFRGKGGDTAVAALAILRREVDPDITLTVVGPDTWQLPGAIPDGVRFLGRCPLSMVAQLYDSHDLFVLPSRQEAFGIAFAEATARGMPAIGRDAIAAPEIITPGVNGGLLDSDDPAELAKMISEMLADDVLYQQCHEMAVSTREHFSWDRAGREAVDVVARMLTR